MLLLLLFLSANTVYNVFYCYWLPSKRRKGWIVISAIVTSLIGSVYLSFHGVVFWFFLGVLSLYYGIQKLRKSARGKIYIIALVWATSITFSLKIQHNIALAWEDFILFAVIYLFVLAITIPFDIRDAKKDLPSFRTIPQQFGDLKAIKISYFLLVGSALLSFFIWANNPIVLIAYLATILAAGLHLKLNKIKQPYYCSFYIESLSMYPAIIYSIFFLLF